MIATATRTGNLYPPKAPDIAPITDPSARRLVSVMLPTFEPTMHLHTALRSVLQQDLGRDQMQIAVVDDASQLAKIEELVREADPTGRVEVYRSKENLGLAGNWNRCIDIARGEIVHLLHQDDWIDAGFYRHMLSAFSHQHVGMAFCRHSLTDGNGNVTRRSHRERLRAGILRNWLESISERQRIQCVSAVVRRTIYEKVGGYRPDLCYALDWEMWVRIAAHSAVWYEPKMLAYYRRHDQNETSRLHNSGETYADTLKAIAIFAEYLPATSRDRLISKAYRSFAERALKQLSSTARCNGENVASLLKLIESAVEKLSDSPRLSRTYRKQIATLSDRLVTQRHQCGA